MERHAAEEPDAHHAPPEGEGAAPAAERSPLVALRDVGVKIEKTFLEGGSVVFYEVRIEGLPLPRLAERRGRAAEKGGERELEGRGGAGVGADGAAVTIRRRYRQFKTFHRRLQQLVNASNAGTGGSGGSGEICEGRAVPKRVLPQLPPLRPKLLVDHASQNFVSERSSALQSYLGALLRDPALAPLVLGSEELLQWLSDLPEPFYAPRKGNCPSLFWSWDMYSPSDVSTWGGGVGGSSSGSPSTNGRRSGSISTDSGGCREEEDGLFPPRPVPWNSDHVDHALNERIGLFRGNLWQLTVDAMGLDAPGDYAPAAGSLFAETVRVAGSRFQRSLKKLDECRIGDVNVLPCCHGLNLPARYIIMTGGAYFVREHESASYSGLHLSYTKLLEAAVDYECRTIALDCMFSEDKHFPKERAAQVALRTVRHFLECYGSMVERVILVARTAEDYDALQEAATYYFPRTEEEAGRSHAWADRHLDMRGDFTIRERAFRIGASPLDIPSLK